MILGYESKKDLYINIWTASRPLSLTLALYSTTLGTAAAHLEGKLFTGNLYLDLWKIILVTTAGLIVQTGTNFINDYFECEYKHREIAGKRYNFLGKMRSGFDILVFFLGISCFVLTALIGLYLIYLTTPRLLIVGLLGIIGGYSYTGEPIVYKKRGLGTPLSFILMGPLMVYGSYLVFAGHFSWQPIILGLPVSLLIPLMMMSNELRDYTRDKELGIRTLTVRMGYRRGKKLYLSLILASYSLTLLYVMLDLLSAAGLLVFATVPLAVKSYQNTAAARQEGVPTTNKLHLCFGFIFIMAMLYG